MPLPRRYENRYLVLKWDDLQNTLNAQDMDHLVRIMQQVATFRQAHGHPNRQYVVVSDKRPSLYEEVWGMFLADIAEADAAQRRRWRQELNETIRRMSEQLSTTQAEPTPEESDSAGDENYALPGTLEANGQEVDSADYEVDEEENVAPASPSTGQFSARHNVSEEVRPRTNPLSREELTRILNTSMDSARDLMRTQTSRRSPSVGSSSYWQNVGSMSFDEMESSMNTAWGGRSPSE